MVGPFLAPCLRIWLFSGLNLAPWQKVDLATLHNMLRFRVMAQFVLYASIYFRQKATKSLHALKLDVTGSYVGHAFQTCHTITSNYSCV